MAQGQILALAFGCKSFAPFKGFRLRSAALPEGRDAARQRLFERRILGAAQRQVHEKLRPTTVHRFFCDRFFLRLSFLE